MSGLGVSQISGVFEGPRSQAPSPHVFSKSQA